jgi:hypothetical protein
MTHSPYLPYSHINLLVVTADLLGSVSHPVIEGEQTISIVFTIRKRQESSREYICISD